MTENKTAPEHDDYLNIENIYKLRLFVTGATPNSTRAISNLANFCESYLKGKYELEVIDVYQQPEVAEKEQIIALPLLIKLSPGPQRRMVGDLSDTKKILRGFNLIPA
jgi:circadian clock protein KaiB